MVLVTFSEIRNPNDEWQKNSQARTIFRIGHLAFGFLSGLCIRVSSFGLRSSDFPTAPVPPIAARRWNECVWAFNLWPRIGGFAVPSAALARRKCAAPMANAPEFSPAGKNI